MKDTQKVPAHPASGCSIMIEKKEITVVKKSEKMSQTTFQNVILLILGPP